MASWLGLAAPVYSGRSAVRGMAVFPQGHGFKEVHQFVGEGIRAGFAPLNDKDMYWFFSGTFSAKGSIFLTLYPWFPFYHITRTKYMIAYVDYLT